MALSLFTRKQKERTVSWQDQHPTRDARRAFQPADAMAMEKDPLGRYLQLERFGCIVRYQHQWRDHPQVQAVFQKAVEAIDEAFALVPEGFVSLARSTNDYPGSPEIDLETQPFLLARRCITNAQFQKFVDSGGYEDLELWPKDVWPHLIDFKDLTGESGPRYWQNGRHDRRKSEHPVVGICYYEAMAYAGWAGYRLPSGAEWQMAASWRIRSSAHVLRRYPWGDSMDPERCNLWVSDVHGTVPVDRYESGAAPNGVLQLIGNVWEWCSSDYEVVDECGRMVVGDMLLKEIRGGAFDTYFPSQATSAFRTGLPSLIRAHNVGFRCIVDLSNPAAESEEGDQ